MLTNSQRASSAGGRSERGRWVRSDRSEWAPKPLGSRQPAEWEDGAGEEVAAEEEEEEARGSRYIDRADDIGLSLRSSQQVLSAPSGPAWSGCLVWPTD